MKIGMKLVLVILIFFTIITGGCGSSPSVPANSGSSSSVPDELDLAIRDALDYLNDNIPKGSMIVILNVQSDSASLSDYVIDELIANAVNDKIFKIVDRRQLDLIRAEQNFQLSGEVDDKLAVSIGKVFGAQTIVSGKVVQVGERYRMTIRALEVQTAQVQGQYNRNIVAGKTITALMKNGGSGRGTQNIATGTTGIGNSSTVGNTTQVTSNVLNVNSVTEWNTAINKIRNGGNNQKYVINITDDVSVPAPPDNETIFNSVTGVTVTIQGGGTISLSVQGSLMKIAAGQTVVVSNVTLRGRSDNNSPVIIIMSGGIFRMEGNSFVTGNNNKNKGGGGVNVDGGTFIMQGNATVSDNIINRIGTNDSGGGVFVGKGTFIMQGGTVSGNTARSTGGGVYVNFGATFTLESGTISGNTTSVCGGGVSSEGTFIMKGGTISGNTTKSFGGGGGGVYVGYRGTFTMQGGTISNGNTADIFGGGVYVEERGTFKKIGGTISGNDVALDDINTAQRQGHAVYLRSKPERWRNATARPNDKTDGYGFWLND